jgi:hypothetical protein
VLYVAGYGRSGSTVVSTVLGSHPDLVAVGELTHLLDDWADPTRACACGEGYSRCPFWADLFPERPAPAAARLVRRIDRGGAAALARGGRVTERDRRAYGESQRMILDYVRTRAGKPIVVDASKSARLAAGRASALARLAGQDVYVLHLVRSGVATLDSLVTRGSNWALEGHRTPRRLAGLRGVVGWARANLRASLLGARLGPSRYLRLRYEDLLAEPASWLRTLGRFVGIDAEELVRRVEAGDPFRVSHVVGGNRLRLQPTVTLWRAAPPPARPGLPPGGRAMFLVLGGWLERWYGYRGGVRADARRAETRGR